MNKELICNVEIFTTATIFYEDGTKENVDNNELAKWLAPTCYSKGYEKVHFFGNEQYINGLIEEFKTTMATNYNKTIEVEVN